MAHTDEHIRIAIMFAQKSLDTALSLAKRLSTEEKLRPAHMVAEVDAGVVAIKSRAAKVKAELEAL